MTCSLSGKVVDMKFSGPEEIYKELVEESEESWLHGLMAFAVLLIIMAFFVINDTSPVEIGSQLRNQVEDKPNG